jgi:mono/diheme cytochrome c family protein
MGHADGRGTAAGPMGEAIDESLSHLKPGDITAMVAYLRSVPSAVSSDLAEPKMSPAPALQASSDAERGDPRGKQVYEGACAGCHGWTGISPVIPFATLTGARSVNDPTGNNVAQVIIAGAQRHYAIDSNNMPAFGSTYSDAEIASVANYVTARYGATGSGLTAESIARLRAAD